ncbi:Tetratricopeptide repeat protein 36 [Geranomyces variabilis]|nr:Tetratricopeptide repeat protein 36 [Geranomyces variabilis]
MSFPIPQISRADEDILNVIFNPGTAISKTSRHRNSGLSLDGVAPPEVRAVESPVDIQLLERLKALEQEAVYLAEQKDVEGGIAKLDECILLCPEYASAYNNRAQAYRLKGENDKALGDLDFAIKHGEGNPPILKQAYTQRAIIRKAQGNEVGAESDFAQGARFGNEIAKAAVKNNPYAKMCNAIVMEAMSKLGAS